MSFLIPCPHCGPRSVYEFRFGGEARERPAPDADPAAWSAYLHVRRNAAGVQTEWWFHRAGCRQWFQVERHTATNQVLRAFRVEEDAGHDAH